MSVPAAAWVWWLVITAATFAVLEVSALVSKRRGDTLSERLRAWLGISPPQPWRRWGILGFLSVLIGFSAWLAIHIVAG